MHIPTWLVPPVTAVLAATAAVPASNIEPGGAGRADRPAYSLRRSISEGLPRASSVSGAPIAILYGPQRPAEESAPETAPSAVAPRQELVAAPSLVRRSARVASGTVVPVRVPAQAPAASSPAAPASSAGPEPRTLRTIAGSQLYVAPGSSAFDQAQSWRSSRPADAARMDVLAAQPTAVWLGGWSGDVRAAAARSVSAANGRTAVFVAYNIPGRDCGGYSAGGTDASSYRSWIRQLAAGIGSRPAAVILEPDAVAQISCLNGTASEERYALLSDAVAVLSAQPAVSVYLDAGHAGWVPAGDMAARLQRAGIAAAAGFSLNVSNFGTTAANTAYGKQVAAATGKGFLIDTGRNGNGPAADGQWCNPSGRAVGIVPTTATGDTQVHAYLWVKVPGESDGTCGGGPSAGSWWPEYALGLTA